MNFGRPSQGDSAPPKVVFVTDRNRESSSRWERGFGHKAFATSWDLTCGEVKVVDDGSREVGNLYDLRHLSADPSKYAKGSGDCENFVSSRAINGRVLVFLHGFNTSFVDAIRRGVSFAQDIHYSGLIVVWSWPSYASEGAYSLDEGRSGWTTPHFESFIRGILNESLELKIDFIAHSMGSRILLQAIYDSQEKISDSVTFAAPDVGSDDFKSKLLRGRGGLPIDFDTLYGSSFDWALIMSKIIHFGSARAGTGGGDILTIPGMESVDVNVPWYSLINHSWVFDHPYSLRDFETLVKIKAHASQRGLLSIRKNDGTYFFRINP